MKTEYFESVVMVEKLYRLFLDVVRKELDARNWHDISNVQAIVIYHIGHGQLTVGELTNRGYYMGSNVSYNLRKMVSFGYIEQIPSPHDKRASYIKLTEKGFLVHEMLDNMFEKHAHKLQSVEKLRESLKDLESFWLQEVR
ncbi:MAG: hypothetical protein HEEMFOPI_01826 [Holosporales bacterium]